MSRKSMMNVMHKATGETALGRRAPDGCVLVQFDRFEHPQSHGWHLYPRHHFQRRTFYPLPFARMVRREYTWCEEAAPIPPEAFDNLMKGTK